MSSSVYLCFPLRVLQFLALHIRLNPFWVYFGVWCQEVFQFRPCTCSCPVLPAPFIEEAVSSLSYILASFVNDKVLMGEQVYFWAFYLVPLVYISVFVPVPCCLLTVALQYSLKSGRLIPPAQFFLTSLFCYLGSLMFLYKM